MILTPRIQVRFKNYELGKELVQRLDTNQNKEIKSSFVKTQRKFNNNSQEVSVMEKKSSKDNNDLRTRKRGTVDLAENQKYSKKPYRLITICETKDEQNREKIQLEVDDEDTGLCLVTLHGDKNYNDLRINLRSDLQISFSSSQNNDVRQAETIPLSISNNMIMTSNPAQNLISEKSVEQRKKEAL